MHSRNPSNWVAKCIFRLVLTILGTGMELSCRLSESFRRQVTRDLTVQIGSADGVFHHYVFAPRAVTSRSESATNPTLSLCFDNAWQGSITLLSPCAVGKIVQALLERTAEYQGNAVLILWFYGLTRFVLPIGKTRRLRAVPPEAYLAPDLDSKVAGRIVREPAATELDPNWKLAHEQHKKMVMVRGSNGESVPMW